MNNPADVHAAHAQNVEALPKSFQRAVTASEAQRYIAQGLDLPADQHLVITPGGHYLTLPQFKAYLEDQRARAHKHDPQSMAAVYGMHA
jgi:hypothetical protein